MSAFLLGVLSHMGDIGRSRACITRRGAFALAGGIAASAVASGLALDSRGCARLATTGGGHSPIVISGLRTRCAEAMPLSASECIGLELDSVDPDDLLPTNRVCHVRHTIFDAAKVRGIESYDDLYADKDFVFDALWVQMDGWAPVYDFGDDEYAVVKFEHIRAKDFFERYIGAVVARDDMSGTVLDEVVIDLERELAWVPKSYLEGGEYTVTLQLCCACDVGTKPTTTVPVEISGDGVRPETVEVTSCGYDYELRVPVTCDDPWSVDVSQFSFYIDGIDYAYPAQMSWDASQGELVVRICPHLFERARVVREVGAESVLAGVLGVLGVRRAFAANIDDADESTFYPWGYLEWRDDLESFEGNLFEYTGLVIEADGQGGWHAGDPGVDSAITHYLENQDRLDTLYKCVFSWDPPAWQHGANNDPAGFYRTGDIRAGTPAFDSAYRANVTDVYTLWTVYHDGTSQNHCITLPGCDVTTAYSAFNDGVESGVPAFWSTIKSARGNNSCVVAPCGCTHSASAAQWSDGPCRIYCRMLDVNKDAAKPYVILGMQTYDGVGTQGQCVQTYIKFHLHVPGELTVKKVAGDGVSSSSSFEFKVTIAELADVASRVVGGNTFTNGVCTFSLTPGDSKKLTDLEVGWHYAVEETAVDGIVTTWSGDATTGVIDSGAKLQMTCTNAKNGSLTIEKAVVSGEQNRAFQFHVAFSGTGAPASEDFTLAHGQTKSWTDLPIGVSWEFTETTPSNYSVEWDSNRTGTITGAQNVKCTCKNTKDAPGSLTISKVVEGEDDGTAFTFHVRFSGEGAPSNADFTLKGGQHRSWSDIPAGVTWSVSEDAVDGYSPTWSDATSGTVTAGSSTSLTCTNHRNVPDNGHLRVRKQVNV